MIEGMEEMDEPLKPGELPQSGMVGVVIPKTEEAFQNAVTYYGEIGFRWASSSDIGLPKDYIRLTFIRKECFVSEQSNTKPFTDKNYPRVLYSSNFGVKDENTE